MTFDQMVADVLKRSRQDTGYSRLQLAVMLGVDERLIRRYEQALGRVGAPFRHGHRGRVVDEWLDVCGWELEIVSGPASEWMRGCA